MKIRQLKLKKPEIIAISLSLVAIILTQTQFRPIYTLFDKPKIEIIVDVNHLWISHAFGRLIMEQYIKIKNVGKADETVKRITYYIKKSNSKSNSEFEGLYHVQSAFNFNEPNQNGIGYIQYPLFEIFMPFETSFEYPVMIYENKSIEIQKMEDKLRNEIYSEIKINHYYGLQISDTLENKVFNEINNGLKGFSSGEYYLLIIPFDNEGKPILPEIFYNFIVFESDIERLNEISEEYKTGGNNIYYGVSGKDYGFITKLYYNADQKILFELINSSKKFW